MSTDPVAVYTPQAFLDAEYARIAGSWFWKTYLRHLDNQMLKHFELAMASASGPAEHLRVATAMASAFKTALVMPELIRTGNLLFPGQVHAAPPKRGRQSVTDGDENADAEAG
jgi:hypothetical protein